jgi:hypothetical protein
VADPDDQAPRPVGRLRRYGRLARAVASAAPRAAVMSALARRDFAAGPGGAMLRRIGLAPRWRAAPAPVAAAPAVPARSEARS